MIWLRYEYEYKHKYQPPPSFINHRTRFRTNTHQHSPTYTQRILRTEKAIFLSTMAQTIGSINPVNAIVQRVFYNNNPSISMYLHSISLMDENA